MLFASLAVLVAGATSVHAHGYAQVVTVGGTVYQAFHPFDDPYATPVPQTVERKVADDGPINFDDAALTCNKGGDKGNGLTATVAAGQDVQWTMNRWPSDHKGPISVYMANCGGDCDSFAGSGNDWFKLSSTGLIDAGSFTWASDKLISDGLSWTATVPSNIKAGNYLMRLELLALHSTGQPQLYPSCTQLTVTGGGDGAPSASELVSIPGVYKQGDPALFGDIYSQPQSWPQVGPDVAAFISGAAAPAPAPAPTSSQGSTSAAPSSASSDPEPTPTYSQTKTSTKTSTKTASSTPTKGSKTCRRKAFVKKNSHHAKRGYMRALSKKRM